MATPTVTGEPALEGHYATYLSSASTIIGNLVLQNAARIDGKAEGDIVAMAQLIIGETADVAARIEAPSVVVCGRVSGDIRAKRIELRPTARVFGNLTSPILKVRPAQS